MNAATTAPPVWLTAAEAATRIRRPAQFVRRAASAGELHGHQRCGDDGRPVRKAYWLFAPTALDAYVRNGDLAAQQQACGCAGPGPIAGRGGAA